MSNYLFTYGTLRAKEVVLALLGRDLRAAPGVLADYYGRRMAGRSYPGIVARTGEVVHGTVYAGATAEDIRILDTYEGDGYTRELVDVRSDIESTGTVSAFVYVLTPEEGEHLGEDEWRLDVFRETQLAGYVAHCRELRSELLA